MTDQTATDQTATDQTATDRTAAAVELHDYRPTVPRVYIVLAWLWVAVPFTYGVFELTLKVKQLFE